MANTILLLSVRTRVKMEKRFFSGRFVRAHVADDKITTSCCRSPTSRPSTAAAAATAHSHGQC